LIGTAHGSNIDSLLVNPTLNDLLGGIQTVTLSDEEARRRGTQKSVLERKSPPTFDVLIEIQERDHVVVHAPLAETVDEALRGRVRPPQVRLRGDDGEIISRIDTNAATAKPSPFEPAPFLGGQRSVRRGRERQRRFDVDQYIAGQQRRERAVEQPAPTVRTGPPLSIFPYGVSRSYLEQSLREMRLPVRIQHHVDDADVVLTLKNYYRRHDSPVRAAESSGIPIHVLRSNTVAQIKGALARVYGVEPPEDSSDDTEPAMQDVLEGIEQMQRTGNDVELTPQNAYVRRLQHQLVESHALTARSTGDEPNRRLVILRPSE
jgi:R3H domain